MLNIIKSLVLDKLQRQGYSNTTYNYCSHCTRTMYEIQDPDGESYHTFARLIKDKEGNEGVKKLEFGTNAEGVFELYLGYHFSARDGNPGKSELLCFEKANYFWLLQAINEFANAITISEEFKNRYKNEYDN